MHLSIYMVKNAILCAFILFAFISCTDSKGPVAPNTEIPDMDDPALLMTLDDTDPDRHLIGYWYFDLKAQTAEPMSVRTISNHLNIFDLLMLPEFAGSLVVEYIPLSDSGPFAPPALRIKTTIKNEFDVTGWNVRGILIDDSGLLDLSSMDGWTAQWDDGGDIPLNPYMNFMLPDGSLPDGESIDRDYVIESPTGVIPDGLWFAVDAGTEGLIKSATRFPVAAVNGVFRYPGDQAPILCRLSDPLQVVTFVVAGSNIFSGSHTFLTEQDSDGDYREWTGTLEYDGSLAIGYHSLYFGASSPYDIPTLAVARVRVDPGPFATGPADTGCSQHGYNPARTCRTTAPIAFPLNNFVVRPPASASGIIIGDNNKVIRRLEDDRSIAIQYPGLDYPEWTRLIGESDLATAPAIGNDGTIFFLEPEQGRLRALYPDGSDRWIHEFGIETHTDLVLTSSPIGGLLITILRNDGKDIAIVAVGTDGHLRWRFDLISEPEGPSTIPRLAVGPGGSLYYTIPTGGAFALDLLGNPKWAMSKSGWVESNSPVVGDDDRLFFIVNNGQMVACLTPSGAEQWEYILENGSLANFPSLSYNGDLFIIIGQGSDYVEIRSLDGNDGTNFMNIISSGARGYVIHGTHNDFVYVQRDDPDPPFVCCDDFFISRHNNGDMNWSLHTPGVTQIGAYPVVSPHNAIYVQGPDGMYVVMY